MQQRLAALERQTQQTRTPQLVATHLGSQAIPPGGDFLAFDTADVDTDQMLDVASDPTRIYIGTPGTWLFHLGFEWGNPPAAGSRHGLWFDGSFRGTMAGTSSGIAAPVQDHQAFASARFEIIGEAVRVYCLSFDANTISDAVLVAQWLSP